MRIGLALPQYGPFADGQRIGAVATAAEQAGFDSLWVSDRLLVAKQPRNLYPGFGGESPVPERYRTFLDPIVVLSTAAAATSTVRLGTNVLVVPWYPAPILARTLSTVDRVSGGRLAAGLGIGWSADEMAAAGVLLAGRGAQLDEVLDVLDAAWSEGDTYAHDGARWQVPPSYPGVRPVQRPRPPLYLSAFSEAALRRVGQRADGWLPADLPPWLLGKMWAGVRQFADEAGRNPDDLWFVPRVTPLFDAEDGPGGRTVAELAEYLLAAQAEGAHEVVVDLQQSCTGTDELLQTAIALRERVLKG